MSELHIDDIETVEITDDGYLVNDTTIVNEDDVALMIYLENGGAVFEAINIDDGECFITPSTVFDIFTDDELGLFMSKSKSLSIDNRDVAVFSVKLEARYGQAFEISEQWYVDGINMLERNHIITDISKFLDITNHG